MPPFAFLATGQLEVAGCSSCYKDVASKAAERGLRHDALSWGPPPPRKVAQLSSLF